MLAQSNEYSPHSQQEYVRDCLAQPITVNISEKQRREYCLCMFNYLEENLSYDEYQQIDRLARQGRVQLIEPKYLQIIERGTQQCSQYIFGIKKIVGEDKMLEFFENNQTLAQTSDNQIKEANQLTKLGIEQLKKALAINQKSSWQEAELSFQKALNIYQSSNNVPGEALSRVGLGNVYQSQPQQSQEHCQKGLALYQKINNSSGVALSQLCLGFSAFLQRQTQKAEKSLENARDLYQKNNNLYGEAASSSALSSIYLIQGKIEQGRQLIQKAIIIYQKLEEPSGEAFSLLFLGNTYLLSGEFEQAINILQQAKSHFRNLQKSSGEAAALLSMNMAYSLQENSREAIKVSEELNQILQKEGLIIDDIPQQLQKEIINLGVIKLFEQQYQQDIGEVKKQKKNSIKNNKELSCNTKLSGQGEFDNNLGINYTKVGQYEKAIELFESALKIYQQIGNCLGQADALGNLGTGYFFVGKYEKSIQYSQQAQEMYKRLGKNYEVASSLNDMGMAQLSLGLNAEGNTAESNIASAIISFEEAKLIFNQLKESRDQAYTLNHLGIAYFFQGKSKQGTDYLEQSLTRFRQLDEKRGEVIALGNLGAIYMLQQNYKQAIAHFQESLLIMENLEEPAGKASLLGMLGIAWFKSGNLVEAKKTLSKSIDAWEYLRQPLQDLNKVSLFDIQTDDINNVLQQTFISENKPEEALEIAEQGKARAFVELLAKRLNPSESIPTNIKSPTLKQIQKIASEQNATLVEYSIAYELVLDNNNLLKNQASKLFIWVVQPRGSIVLRQVDLKSLDGSIEELVSEARQYMGVGRYARGRTNELAFKIGDLVRLKTDSPEYLREVVNVYPERNSVTVRFANDPNAPIREVLVSALEKAASPINKRLQQFHQLLIAPIADLLPINNPEAHVIFIPHQELFLVPFSALQDQQGNYLIEKHTIRTVPAIQVLDLTHQRQNQISNQVNNILVVGNPSPMPKELSALAGSEEEANTVALQLKTKAIIGKDATEETIRQQLPTARLIHLATHAIFNEQEPLQGAIAFAPSGDKNDKDGLLTAEEILDYELKADLAVLSACDTGQGRITGDGVIGLSRSWIAAGVPSLVVSLWQVPDKDATPLLMAEFYQNLENNQDKAQALRKAMLKTKDKYPDPKNWAAFTLIGKAE